MVFVLAENNENGVGEIVRENIAEPNHVNGANDDNNNAKHSDNCDKNYKMTTGRSHFHDDDRPPDPEPDY